MRCVRCLSVAFTLLLALVASIAAEESKCQTTQLRFASESMDLSKEGDYLFYGVASDVENLRECARICYHGTFCRSALYDQQKKICKLGYANMRKCKKQELLDESQTTTQPMVVIYCISCNAAESESVRQQPLALPADNAADPQSSENLIIGAAQEGQPKTIEKQYQAKVVAAGVKIPTVDNKATVRPLQETECFESVTQHAYIKSAYRVFRGYSLLDCQCTCAQTWVASEVICSSIQYYPDRQECVLNRNSSPDSDERVSDELVAVTSSNTSLHRVTCGQDRQQLFRYLFQMCSYTVLPRAGSQYKVDCNDIVVGHSMKGVAGALEHDVSIETCRCLCFSSSKIEKYGFVCRSATYHPQERDCVLNLYDRWQRPDLFKTEPWNKTVIYLDASCDDKTREKLIDRCTDRSTKTAPSHRAVFDSQSSHKALRGQHTVPIKAAGIPMSTKTVMQADIGQEEKINAHSDFCFLEIPNHVMGNAVLESLDGVTVEQCKCRCVNSGDASCLSITYLPKHKKCWLNKFNRNQKPQLFSQMGASADGPPAFTYFEYLCNSNGRKGRLYAELCSSNGAEVSSIDEKVELTPRRLSVVSQAAESLYAKNLVPKGEVLNAMLKSQSVLQQRSLPLLKPGAIGLPDETVATTTTTTTTAAPEVTTAAPVVEEQISTPKFDYSEYVGGTCSYSALYDAEFGGRNVLDKFPVEDPLHCFVECVKKKCRSANLIQFVGKFKHCHLYGDSAVEYPFANMVTFRKGSVYFEGIACSAKDRSTQ